MEFIEELNLIPPSLSGSVVVMGDFDGVHTGHYALIHEAVSHAKAENLTSILLTYEPSPKKIMKKLAYDSRLTTHAEKQQLLANTDLDIVIFYPVTAKTLQISARNFLRSFLLERLSMRRLVMGGDHHFGHNRRGNAKYLQAAKKRYGFALTVIDEQLTLGKRTSSSRIRTALAEGKMDITAEILGRPYSVTGKVVHGERRGRSIGFPTANLSIDPEKLLPALGVYAGVSVLENGERICSVANLGQKPTVGAFPVGLEVHCIQFKKDIYGQNLTFEFTKRIREEKKFASLDALKAQIEEDVKEAKSVVVF
ncbi:MAG TPA: bifunctional riboflavin kinase/FAD synthetase [Turneriella sp.]|nr:bifunctional riboflavin kinase/FAD synthetase [Turneriella sp.]